VWQFIVRHAIFEKITLSVIASNAFWIAVDTDLNDAEMLTEAHPIFQVAENLFCGFFTFEWLTRWMSFKRYSYACKDNWFVFDSGMVFLMVMETWVLGMFILVFYGGSLNNMGDTSMLRIARLLRLSRMCRMARLLRSCPELSVMLTGLFAAARSVFFTLVLLFVILFVFGIAFTQIAVTASKKLSEEAFPRVFDSMYYLMLHGTLLLSSDLKAADITKEGGSVLTVIFWFFILISAILLMNMLIGVLCELVTSVAAKEKEEMLVAYVKGELQGIMELIDADHKGSICKEQFLLILSMDETIHALGAVGVDVFTLIDNADFVFEADDPSLLSTPVEISMQAFLDMISQMRGSNRATVGDMIQLRRYVLCQLQSSDTRLAEWLIKINRTREQVDSVNFMLIDAIEYFESEEWDSSDDEFFIPASAVLSEPAVIDSVIAKRADVPICRDDVHTCLPVDDTVVLAMSQGNETSVLSDDARADIPFVETMKIHLCRDTTRSRCQCLKEARPLSCSMTI